jgi:hypothetical protein
MRMEQLIEKEVSFTVPYLCPPSGNHYKSPTRYTGKDGFAHMGFKLTKAAKAYKDAVALFARGRTVAPATDQERKRTRYRVVITVVLGPKMRGDSDNFLKVGLDSLRDCGMIHSDAFVEGPMPIVVRDQRDNPRTEFVVTRLEAE